MTGLLMDAAVVSFVLMRCGGISGSAKQLHKVMCQMFTTVTSDHLLFRTTYCVHLYLIMFQL